MTGSGSGASRTTAMSAAADWSCGPLADTVALYVPAARRHAVLIDHDADRLALRIVADRVIEPVGIDTGGVKPGAVFRERKIAERALLLP
jgi:hypothetical protein